MTEKYEYPIKISVLVHSPAETAAVYAALAAGALIERRDTALANLQKLNEASPLVSSIVGQTVGSSTVEQNQAEDTPKVEEAKVRKVRATKTADATKTEEAPKTAAEPKTTGEAETSEEDEFAAFRDADGAGKPAEMISDADLSSACNDAASALGSPNQVKALIAQFVPEGEMVHSRNVPLDKRSDFVEQIKSLHK